MTPDATALTDEALASALRDGDDLALNTLMLRWQIRLRAFLYRHTQNEADALDLAQETFVRIYRHRANYREGARFSTWLFQIALNLARDHARSRVRRPTVAFDDAFTSSSGQNTNKSTNSHAASHTRAAAEAPELTTAHTPTSDALAAERTSAVRAAIAELPDNLRESLILFEYDDRSHAEIAEIVSATPKAIETRLARARELLRKKLVRWLE